MVTSGKARVGKELSYLCSFKPALGSAASGMDRRSMEVLSPLMSTNRLLECKATPIAPFIIQMSRLNTQIWGKIGTKNICFLCMASTSSLELV